MTSVSVIIPAYNEEGYIKDTLESLKKQDYDSFEVIVVCNGCTDSTEKVARKYTKKVYVLKKPNPATARNYGARKASGRYLVFLDADTLAGSNVLKKVANVLEKGDYFGTCNALPKSMNLSDILYSKSKQIASTYFSWSNQMLYCRKKSFLAAGSFSEQAPPTEYHDLRKKLRKAGAKYKLLKDAFVTPSDRRLKKWGIAGVCWYWISKPIRRSNGYYLDIRKP